MSTDVLDTQHYYDSLFSALAQLGVSDSAIDESFKKGLYKLTHFSPRLSAICQAHPEYLKAIFDDPDLAKSRTRKSLQKRCKEFLAHEPDAELGIRKFQWHETLRIAWRDLNNLDDMQTITGELANLADAVIVAVFEMVHRKCIQHYGHPLDKDGAESRMAVIGMGKLGGRELNFSSDVDLMFVYDSEGQTSGGAKGVIQNRNFFIQLAQQVCDVLTRPTPEGFMYRVDTRLRPEGDRGALAVPLMAIEIYYHTYGHNWERQSLLKARHVAGDAAVGQRFMELVTPFTYRKYVDEAEVSDVLQSIDQMRAKSIEAIKNPEERWKNFKNGLGGIRDIEFFVQAVQMLYGGQYPEIKLTGTLLSLRRMHESHLLPALEFESLTQAYKFLRRIEHRLQMVSDQQVYTLPKDKKEQQRLALSLDYDDFDSFFHDYQTITRQVRDIYHEVFRLDELCDITEHILDKEKYDDSTHKILHPYGFLDTSQAFTFFRELNKSPDLHLQPKTTRLFKGILHRLLQYLHESPDSDMALANFEKLTSAFKAKSALYQTLSDSPNLLKLLVSVVSGSNFLTRLVLRDPSLMESIGREGYFEELITPEQMENHYRIMRYGFPERPLREILLRVQNAAMFRSGIRFILGITDIESMAIELTHIADFILQQSMSPAKESLRRRFGEFTREYGDEIAVLGFGKLGGREFNVASDCDVVFVFEELHQTPAVDSNGFFHRWAAKYMDYLQSKDTLGFLYNVDARLRPHGNNSPLVCSYPYLLDYYRHQAQFWEKMALTRARFICGDQRMQSRLEELKHEILFQQTPANEEIASILEMRKKIEREKSGETLKAAPGGLIDVEFIAQALVLCYGPNFEDIRSTSTLHNLRSAAQAGVLPQEEADELIHSYLFLREVENRMRIVNNVSIDALPNNPQELEKLTRRYALRLGAEKPSPERFLQLIEEHAKKVRRIYDRFFESQVNQ